MTLFNILLYIHIVCGGISLLIGLYVLSARKGDKKHKKLGKIFFYSMLSSAVIALPMSYLHPSYFLFIIGVFTSYMLLSGKRSLKKKKLSDVKITDWILTATMFIFGIVFIGFGFYHISQTNYFGTVFLAFGSISLLFVYQDYINFKGRSRIKNYWLSTHIQRMTGSYIASATAFLVVNNTILPGIIAWLLPSFVLTPLIIKWSRKWEIKLTPDKKAN